MEFGKSSSKQWIRICDNKFPNDRNCANFINHYFCSFLGRFVFSFFRSFENANDADDRMYLKDLIDRQIFVLNNNKSNNIAIMKRIKNMGYKLGLSAGHSSRVTRTSSYS